LKIKTPLLYVKKTALIIPMLKLFITLPLIAMLFTACGSWPEPLATRGDVQGANPEIKQIIITDLPIELYPLLARFSNLWDINLDDFTGTNTTDRKLEALASLDLSHLGTISLLNCREVTDKGISQLLKFHSLNGLQLEGTSITDAGCATVAQMQLIWVNVANCPKVTLRGLKLLIVGPRLTEIGFSAGDLTQSDITNLIDLFASKSGEKKWLSITDPKERLNAGEIEKYLKAKNIRGFVDSAGVLHRLNYPEN
jgi:hypothetical protein